MQIRPILLASLLSLSLVASAPAQETTPTATPAPMQRHDNRTQRIMEEQSNGSAKFGMDINFLTENLDRVLDQAITDGDTSGAVILVLRGTAEAPGLILPVFEKAYGNRAVAPETEPATLDTIYDLASLTKPMATATSIMKLVEQGKIRLTDRVSKHITEWKNTPEEERLKKNRKPNAKPVDRESVTILHLLTHTSGLRSYERFYEKYPEDDAPKKIIEDISRGKLTGTVGGQFIYSDLGFILLGEIVHRVSGTSLDEFAHREIFQPLGMTDTYFNPPADKLARVAPTEWQAPPEDTKDSDRKMLRGIVHDGNARALNGISGHAGLFSTASDVGIFCAMMLRNGASNDGQRILSPLTLATIRKDHANLPGDEIERGLGWDIDSPYNSQKGNLFAGGYGHTGFTGTSIWIEPEEKIAVIIMANRVHPDGKGDVVGLRARVANIVAGSIKKSYKNYQPK